MFRHWSKRGYGQKQEGADNYNGPQQQETERRRVIAQSPSAANYTKGNYSKHS